MTKKTIFKTLRWMGLLSIKYYDTINEYQDCEGHR